MSAQELTGALTKMTTELAKANAYARRTRRRLWFTIVSVVLDVALTVIVAVLAVQGNHSSHAAESAQVASRNLCLAGNTARREQEDIWLYFLGLVGPGKTPAAVHAEALLRGKLHQDLAPRDCTALGGHK